MSLRKQGQRNRPMPAPANDALAPTAERYRHGVVEYAGHTIADDDGRPARPYRAVDTLVAMERRGSITAAMREAGEDFRARFWTAALEPLHAADLGRQPGIGRAAEGLGHRIEVARNQIWRAILALGGITSPAGSCVWHVVGLECTIKEWALEQGWNGRRISEEVASGILVAALGALEAHYRG